jgi:stalled ribosome alternative rescue factor ArfA
MTKRNPIAHDLRSSKYRIRIVKPKKGKGSYDRKKSLD